MLNNAAGKNEKEFQIEWELFDCKSFYAQSLFKNMTPAEFD